jgi:hypothetical protein
MSSKGSAFMRLPSWHRHAQGSWPRRAAAEWRAAPAVPYSGAMPPPEQLRWLFWETDPSTIDVEAQADYVLPRVLEFGGLAEVRWALGTYGTERIHRFFRDVGHPELSAKTIRFWRAFFNANEETWASTPAWRQSSSAPWID